MAVNPGRVYRELLISGTEISEPLQRRIFDWGKSQKDYDLLACLQRHPALSADIDELLGAMSSHQVQAAHVSRPGRDLAELSRRAKKDHRVAVHSTLASMVGLDDDAYAVMAKSDSRAVAYPLIANRHAPDAARRSAMATAARLSGTANNADLSRFQKLLSEFPDLAGSAIEAISAEVSSSSEGNTSRRVVLGAYLSQRNAHALLDDLDQVAINKLMDLLIAESSSIFAKVVVGSNSYSRYHVNSLVRECMEMIARAGSSASVTQAKRLGLTSVLTQHEEKLQGSNEFKDALSRARKQLAETPEAVATMSPARLYNERSIEVLLEAAKTYDTSSPAAAAIAQAIASNPLTTAEIMTVVMNRAHHMGGFNTIKPLVEVHREKPDVVAAIFSHYPYSVSDEVLALTVNPQQVITDLCAQNPRQMGPRLATSRFMTRELVGVLPVSYLETLSNTDDMSGASKAMVVSYIAEKLGEDVRAWEMFEEFAPLAPGSIDQLLTQIRNLQRITNA